MRRVYYSYDQCEEFFPDGGMWVSVTGPAAVAHSEAAAELMVDVPAFEAAMMRALTEWPKSCETNLTTGSRNKRAWLGHAGCWLGVGSPEECTRLGWHSLDDGEQYAANAAADRVLDAWRSTYRVVADGVRLDGAFDA